MRTYIFHYKNNFGVWAGGKAACPNPKLLLRETLRKLAGLDI
jgi:hypothetical protein